MNPIVLLFIIILCGIIAGLITYLIIETRNKKKSNTFYVGGCEGTRWGCCPDGITPKYDPFGRNCRAPCVGDKSGGDVTYKCGETPVNPKYGFCSDGKTPRLGPTNFGCPSAEE